jgi:DNA-binding transcriptional MerR regulator
MKFDSVSNPRYYTESGIETIDVIEAWGLGYHLGNVVKYVSRAGKKDPGRTLEDLHKARWYLDRAIENYATGGSCGSAK